MRRGLIFSITAMFLLVSMLIASVNISLRINNEKRVISRDIPSRIDRSIYDTVSNDIARIFKTSVSDGINVTINEQMPCNISGRFNDYLPFLINVFANDSINNISFTNVEQALYVDNHTKIIYGPNKSWFNVTSNKSINYYSLRINSSSNAVQVSDDWQWVSSGVFINLTIMNSNGSFNLVNGSSSGFVNPLIINSFNVSYDDGSILVVKLSDYLFVNSTGFINTSTTIGVTGNVYTGVVLRIEDHVLDFIKEYKTII